MKNYYSSMRVGTVGDIPQITPISAGSFATGTSTSRLLFGCWLLWLLLPDANASTYVSADCNDFINERPSRVTCGFFNLPLKHEDTTAGKNTADSQTRKNSILIPVMVARSTRGLSENADSAVLIPGGGGPGASMGFGYSYEPGEFLASYDSLRQAGIDVVIVDQRGAGFSQPRLTCGESLDAFKSMLGKRRTIKEEMNTFKSAIVDCRKRMQQEHIAVEHFDTKQSALDFLAIMRELDYPRWFTIATSYATTIAQAMQALEPGAFDRIVLDSPVPLHYQHPMTWERTRQAIVGSIDRCSSDTSCLRRYPDLTLKLDSILATAATSPYLIKIKVYSEDGNASIQTVVADDTTILSILSTAVYFNEHISELPQVLTGLHSGLAQSLNGFAETFWYQATDDTYADGLNLTVHCKERQALEDRYVGARPGFSKSLSDASRLLLQSQLDFCEVWGVAQQPAAIPTLESDTATLILAGGLDPVIAAEDIDNTADYFTNVSVETMAGAGHSVWYQHECARARVNEFLTSDTDMINESSAAECDAHIPGFK